MHADDDAASEQVAPRGELLRLRRTVGLGSLLAVLYFTVSGGPYGLEDIFGTTGPGMGILVLVATPLFFGVPIGLVAAELTSMIPAEGGPYFWVREALGPFWAFQTAWSSWVASWVGVAAYPVLFVEYAAGLVPGLETPVARWLAAVAVVWLLTLLNMRGAGIVGRAVEVFGVFVLAPFAVLVVLGFAQAGTNPLAPLTLPGQSWASALGVGMFVAIWNYSGWDFVPLIAGEVEDPQRNYPRAFALGVPLVTVSYVLPCLAALSVPAVRSIEWRSGAWVTIADTIGGPWLGAALAIGGAVSAVGLLSATVLAASRLPLVLSAEGWLPGWAARVSARSGTPLHALVLSGVLYSLFALGTFRDLVVVSVLVGAFTTGLEFVALLVLRRREPERHRPFRVPGGWPVLALVVAAPSALLLAALANTAESAGLLPTLALPLVLLGSGPVWYLLWPRRRAFTSWRSRR